MIYQVRANMYFISKDEASDFVNDCKIALDKSRVVNEGLENWDPSQVELLLCYHNEVPTVPCVSCGVIECES